MPRKGTHITVRIDGPIIDGDNYCVVYPAIAGVQRSNPASLLVCKALAAEWMRQHPGAKSPAYVQHVGPRQKEAT